MTSLLALDLGTKTGYAIHVAGAPLVSGEMDFSPRRGESNGVRVLRFRRWLAEIMVGQRVGAVAFELVPAHKGTYAGHLYGCFKGEVEAACEERGAHCVPVTVADVKRAATGKGNARKELVVAAARARWPDQRVESDNEADALFVMVCALAEIG